MSAPWMRKNQIRSKISSVKDVAPCVMRTRLAQSQGSPRAALGGAAHEVARRVAWKSSKAFGRVRHDSTTAKETWRDARVLHFSHLRRRIRRGCAYCS